MRTSYGYGSDNFHAPYGVHIMNKNEAKVMRRLRSETGLTEEEIRKVKKYRIMLSQAQKEGQKQKRSELQKEKDYIMKRITRKLKLAKEHPTVQAEFEEEWVKHIKFSEQRAIYNPSRYSWLTEYRLLNEGK